MHALVRKVFGRLKELDPLVEESKLRISDSDLTSPEVKMNVQSSQDSQGNPTFVEEKTWNEQIQSPTQTRR